MVTKTENLLLRALRILLMENNLEEEDGVFDEIEEILNPIKEDKAYEKSLA